MTINKENKIVTLLETNIKEKVETLVKKLNLKNSEQILNINWNIVRTKKYLELKNILNIESKGEENITILVNGRKKFIDNFEKKLIIDGEDCFQRNTTRVQSNTKKGDKDYAISYYDRNVQKSIQWWLCNRSIQC